MFDTALWVIILFSGGYWLGHWVGVSHERKLRLQREIEFMMIMADVDNKLRAAKTLLEGVVRDAREKEANNQTGQESSN